MPVPPEHVDRGCMFDATKALKNPDEAGLKALIQSSRHKAARRIVDEATGDVWYWPAEAGTHREGADALNLSYSRPPGAGDIVTLGYYDP